MTEKVLAAIKKVSLSIQKGDLSDLKSISSLKKKVEQLYGVLNHLEGMLTQIEKIDISEKNEIPSPPSEILTEPKAPFAQKKEAPYPLPQKINRTVTQKARPSEKKKNSDHLAEKDKSSIEGDNEVITLNLVPEMAVEQTISPSTPKLTTTHKKLKNYPLSDHVVRDQEAFSEDILGPRLSSRKSISESADLQHFSRDKLSRNFKIDTSKISVNDKMAFVNFFFGRSSDDYEQFIIKLKNEIYSLDAFHQTLIKEARLRSWDTESSLFQTFQRVLATSNK